MGIVTSGIPREIVTRLAEISGASVFVETGTFQGATTRWAAEHFTTVHTIELATSLYEAHHQQLESLPGVHAHLGDSAQVLPGIVKDLQEQTCLYWLDGHWSGGETAGQQRECPVLSELNCLKHRSQDLILIDDARLFLCAPPRPHNPKHWPTLADIISAFDDPGQRFFQIIDDVIFVVPSSGTVEQALIEYAQARAEATLSGPPTPRLKRVANRLLGR